MAKVLIKLRKEFPDIKFEKIEKLHPKFIKLLYISMNYLKNEFGDNIFDKLDKVLASKEKINDQGSKACLNLYNREEAIEWGITEEDAKKYNWFVGLMFDRKEFGLECKHTSTFLITVILHELFHYIFFSKGLDYTFSKSKDQKLIKRYRWYFEVNKNKILCHFNLCSYIGDKNDQPLINIITEEYLCSAMAVVLAKKLINKKEKGYFKSVEESHCKEMERIFNTAMKFYEELKTYIFKK